MPTPQQMRAARALLGWRQADLAKHSGMSEITIKNVERAKTDPRMTTMNAILLAFDEAGIQFVDNGVRAKN